jgi:CubicO group peptidase (beta-lactamase class C family)
VTRELTIRDLLVHRSGLGLGAGDLLWWPGSDFNRRQIAERLRHIPLATSFRSAYAYDNVLYLVAGEVIEAVTGMSWEDFVATRILAKVGMNDSRVRHSDATAGGNVSGTHGRVDGTVRAIAPFDKDNVDPAGGINASATDMAKWLMVQLDSGRVAGGERLFQPSTTTQLWNIVTPRTPYRLSGARAPLSTNFIGYALGLNVQDYRGQKLLTHTGGLPGYISRVAMLPGQKLGVAVLTNMESSAMEPIVWHVLDYYLGVHDTDWRTAFRELAARNDSMIAATDARAAASRDSTMGPSLPLARYAGHYEDAWYGGVDLAVEDGHLVVRFGHTRLLVGDLSHWQYETFLVRWRDRELRADAFITFTLDAQGRVSEARMAPASPSVDFSFDFQDLKLVPARR